MEYEKQEQLPPYEKASDFLQYCNSKIDSLIKKSRKCLRNQDTASYQQSLIDKALFVTDMPDLAEEAKAAGTNISEDIMNMLDALSDDAWDAIEYASIKKDYDWLENMLIKKPRDHYRDGNFLDIVIHELKQNEEL